MSKEYLEALRDIIMIKDQFYNDRINKMGLATLDEKYNTIKQVLLELKAIKESNPSEALMCLEKIVDKARIDVGSCCHWRECLSKNKCILHKNNLCPDYTRANTIKQALLKSQELNDVLKKYNIENIEELEKILKIFFMKG